MLFVPVPVANINVPVLTFLTHGESVNTSGSKTFAGLNFGAANATRLMIVPVGYDNGTGGSVSTVTVGGVSASKVTGTNSGTKFSEIWIASVPTGTSGSVVISGPTGSWTAGIDLYSALYLNSATATGTSTDTATPIATSVSVSAYGVVVATCYAEGTPTGPTWSGSVSAADNSTIFATGSALQSCAGATYSTQVAATFTASAAIGGASTSAGCTASFR